MAYLTRSQISLYLKESELPNDANDNLNEPLILDLINQIESDITPYLRQAGYKLPVDESELGNLLFITIPVYRYYATAQSGMRTEQITKDYEIALNKLKAIAERKIILTLKTNDTDLPPEKNNKGWGFISTGRR